jgi:hypothetical protein
MSHVIRERNSNTQCFSTIQLDSGERVMVSIAAGEVVILKMKWTGLWPAQRLWSSADSNELADVFFDSERPAEHPLESVRNAVLQCDSIAGLLAAISRRENADPSRSGLPTSFDLTSINDITLIETVQTAFGATLADDASPWKDCMYRPASLLPFPKPVIRSALQSLLDVAEGRRVSPHIDSSVFSTPESADSIRTALGVLDEFIERPETEFPTDPRANILYGTSLRGDA